jgi:hypothetical protein
VSIVVPIYNEGQIIEAVLRMILGVDFADYSRNQNQGDICSRCAIEGSRREKFLTGSAWQYVSLGSPFKGGVPSEAVPHTIRSGFQSNCYH